MQEDGQDDGCVDHEAVAEDRLPEHAPAGEDGELGLEGLVDHALGRRASVEDVDAEEIRHAHAEGRQGETSHVLVGAQADGQEAVNQAAGHRGEERANERERDAEDHVRVLRGVLVEVGAGEAGKAAQIHDARNAEVQIAGFFRDDFAHRAVHDDRAEGDGAQNPCD